MSGVDLQSHLIREGKRMPMIFITAIPDEVSRARALEAGAACFLTKPFDGKTLIDCVYAALKASNHGRLDQGSPTKD